MAMCEHLEVTDFGSFLVRTNGKKRVSTLEKCVSCGEFLTLDSEIVPKNAIIAQANSAKENMRTMTTQVNSDLYDRIVDLIEREGVEKDPSKILNEIIGLGLHHYWRTHEKESPRPAKTVPSV
jgi:hypothetical protein